MSVKSYTPKHVIIFREAYMKYLQNLAYKRILFSKDKGIATT